MDNDVNNADVTLTTLNSFSNALLGQFPRRAGTEHACLFSLGTESILATHDFECFGYPYIQVFEPNVLAEVAILRGLGAERIEELDIVCDPEVARLRDMIDHIDQLSDAALCNLIGALISLSRFRLAAQCLSRLMDRRPNDRAAFEAHWLAFLIANRCNDGQGSQTHFDAMRHHAESGSVPSGRVLDVCTQGVVWRLKRCEIDHDTMVWCVQTGRRLSYANDGCDAETLSSWYRGVAMLPAANGNKSATRRFMLKARDSALTALESRSSSQLRSVNQLKTFYESSIKEFMYVDRNRAKALDAARKLVELDPHWSLNLAETADIHRGFGDHALAGDGYERAARLGPPYVCVHLNAAIRAYRESGNDEGAARCRASMAHLVKTAV